MPTSQPRNDSNEPRACRLFFAHDRLVRHYEMWKRVVDDPAHPDHGKVRSEAHDDPSFRPAFPRSEPVRREQPKVGPNDPYPCGSGKKYKRCCRP